MFSRFLVDVTMGDDALIRYLQKALGACLFGAGYNADHWLMFWHGVGRNGKNTLGDVVAWVLGGYAKTVPTTTLIADEHNNQHPTVIAHLVARGSQYHPRLTKAPAGPSPGSRHDR